MSHSNAAFLCNQVITKPTSVTHCRQSNELATSSGGNSGFTLVATDCRRRSSPCEPAPPLPAPPLKQPNQEEAFSRLAANRNSTNRDGLVIQQADLALRRTQAVRQPETHGYSSGVTPVRLLGRMVSCRMAWAASLSVAFEQSVHV
jgi:hypothetical protein